MELILCENDRELIEFAKLQLEKCVLEDEIIELVDKNYITKTKYNFFIKNLIKTLHYYDVRFGSNLAKLIHNMFTISNERNNKETDDSIIKDIRLNHLVIFDLMVSYKILILLFLKNKLIHNKKEDILKLKELATEFVKGYLKSINEYKEDKELEIINNIEMMANEYMIKVISMEY